MPLPKFSKWEVVNDVRTGGKNGLGTKLHRIIISPSKLPEQELNPIYRICWYIAMIIPVPPTGLKEGEEGWDV